MFSKHVCVDFSDNLYLPSHARKLTKQMLNFFLVAILLHFLYPFLYPMMFAAYLAKIFIATQKILLNP